MLHSYTYVSKTPSILHNNALQRWDSREKMENPKASTMVLGKRKPHYVKKCIKCVASTQA